MNTDTGHLISRDKYLELLKEEASKEAAIEPFEKLDELKREKAKDYEQVTKELEVAAKRKLKGKDEAMVSLTSGGKLSKWAAKKRKQKRKMVKQSRKKNR